MKNHSIIKISSVAFFAFLASSAFAQETNGTKLDYNLDAPNVTLSNKDEGVDEQKEADQEDEPFLPFFGKEARERGYELPKPYGINVNYMTIHQNIDVKSIAFDGLLMKSKLFGKIIEVPIPSDMFKIDVHSTRQRSHTETLRLDGWLFPFMNVYGVVGHTKGKSISKIDVSSTSGLVKPILDRMGLQGLDFVLRFKGTTYGLGTTLAGGFDNWFSLVDINYTRTKLNIIDGNIKAFTLAPRVGYRFTLPAVDAIKLPESKFSLWVGAMYQSVDQNFHGNLSKLQFSPKLQGIISAVNQGKGKFNVKQRMESPWNMLAGFRWEVTPSFNIVTEAGFIKRNSFFAALEYRF